MSASAKAISYAKDILGAETKAAWGPDWPYEMAEGVLELRDQRDSLEARLRSLGYNVTEILMHDNTDFEWKQQEC